MFFWRKIGYEQVYLVLNTRYPSYSPCLSLNQPHNFLDILRNTSSDEFFVVNAQTFDVIPNWSEADLSVFDVEFFRIANRLLIAITERYSGPGVRLKILEYFQNSYGLSMLYDFKLP